MKGFQLAIKLNDFVREERSILFAASGPCISLLPTWLPLFKSVAVHQQTALDVPGEIDYGFFVDYQPTETARPAFPRIKNFIVPEMLNSNCNVNDKRTWKECGIPEDRIVWFARNLHAAARAGAERVIIETNDIWWCYSATPHGIQILSMLGYEWIFCLGFSDLEGKIDHHHRNMRLACEVVADAVAVRYGTRVVFWTPDMTPENWRTIDNRGFRLTR